MYQRNNGHRELTARQDAEAGTWTVKESTWSHTAERWTETGKTWTFETFSEVRDFIRSELF